MIASLRWRAEIIMNIFTQFFKKNYKDEDQRKAEIIRDLLQREAEIGGRLFGPLPKGSSRKFFRLEKNTWIWVENWQQNGKQYTKTTKYLIKPTELLKSTDGGHYQRTSLQEAKNFEQAVYSYVEQVDKKIYGNIILSS
jgi:hypothetical protein